MPAKIRSTTRALFAVVVATLLLAACGGGGEDDAASPAEGGGAGGSTTSTITMRDNEYAPADPIVSAGELEIVNEGKAPHTFTIEGEDIDVEVEAGQTKTATVDLEPGAYTLFCEFHRTEGMETMLTIQ